jgi:hypothetical protein
LARDTEESSAMSKRKANTKDERNPSVTRSTRDIVEDLGPACELDAISAEYWEATENGKHQLAWRQIRQYFASFSM